MTPGPLLLPPLLLLFGVGSCSSQVVPGNLNGTALSSPSVKDPYQEYYKYDGTGNNVENPLWGAANTSRLREFPPVAAYVDGLSIPRTEETVEGLPSARRIMESLFRTVSPERDKKTNQLLVEFGLFITTDVTRSTEALPLEEHALPVPCDGQLIEYRWCPGLGVNFSMPFQRTIHNNSTAKDSVRRSVNLATSFLDLSNIYGMDEQFARQVLFRDRGLLPLDERGLPARDEDGKYIISDSKRATLSPGVFSLFTVFMRYHNLRAMEHAKKMGPNTTIIIQDNTTSWEIFQRARMDTIALYQSIFEQKYVPSLLGKPLDPYLGYDPKVNPAVDVFFSGVAMRYGHSAMSGIIRILDSQFQPSPRDPILIRDSILAVPGTLELVGGQVEPILRGLVTNPGKGVDGSVIDDLNIHNAASVFDIQRGRECGIPPFNAVREAFGLAKAGSFEGLIGDDDNNSTAEALRSLFGPNGVDQVDAIVGALLEPPNRTEGSLLGPVFTLSLRDQFQRLRDGDRLWYKNRLPPVEVEALPTLSELIKLVSVGDGEMEYFPSDAFLTFDSSKIAAQSCSAGDHAVSIMDGSYHLSWEVVSTPQKEQSLEMLISVQEPMEGAGYVGLAWKSQTMKGAEIWFCPVVKETFSSYLVPSSCTPTAYPAMFSCCLATGDQDVPQCSSNAAYPIEVNGWCLTDAEVRILLSVPLCEEKMLEGNVTCFNASESMDFIAAYNTLGISAHGPYSRGSGSLDLLSGVIAVKPVSRSQTGFFAAHGLFMLFTWMVLVPVGIYIVRYMKTRSWRILAHISIMSIVGSLMIPLVTTTEVVVPDSSNKYGEHRIVGIVLASVFVLMAVTGRLRYMLLEGSNLPSQKAAVFAVYFHKFVGLSSMFLAFWNCYTGLVRIGPDDTFVVMLTVNSKPLGYNVKFFDTLRTIYWPYVACILALFACREVQKFRWKVSARQNNHTNNIWADDVRSASIEKMSLKTFVESTKNGRNLCIVDGRVLDLQKFQDFHPGGRHVLRFAQGSDITAEFLGRRDVDGLYHNHSPAARKLARKLVTAILDESGPRVSTSIARGLGSIEHDSAEVDEQHFTRARVVGVQYLTPALAKENDRKSTILLRLAIPGGEVKAPQKSVWRIRAARTSHEVQAVKGACTFVFRERDRMGATIERQYTPLSLEPALSGNQWSLFFPSQDVTSDERSVDFLISLLPRGKMSNMILNMKPGSSVLLQGPRINENTESKLAEYWNSVVMFASGTGIAPMLQMINHYLSDLETSPSLFLVWVLKSPRHCYLFETGIEELASRSEGRFKWMVLYSSGKSGVEAFENDEPANTSRLHNFLELLADSGLAEAVQDVFLSSFLGSGKNSVGGFLRNLKSKSLQVDGVDFDRYNPAGTWSEKNWAEWQDGSVFLEGSFDKDFIKAVFRASSGKVEDIEAGPLVELMVEEACERIADDYRSTLILESGSPSFDATVLRAAIELGFKGDQIVAFPMSNKPMPRRSKKLSRAWRSKVKRKRTVDC